MNMGILSYSYQESEVSVRLKPDAQSCKTVHSITMKVSCLDGLNKVYLHS